MNTYKDKYYKLVKEHDALNKLTKSLINQLALIKRKCNREGLWLSAGLDPYKPLTDDEQQGPMVTKLFDIVDKIQKEIK